MSVGVDQTALPSDVPGLGSFSVVGARLLHTEHFVQRAELTSVRKELTVLSGVVLLVSRVEMFEEVETEHFGRGPVGHRVGDHYRYFAVCIPEQIEG